VLVYLWKSFKIKRLIKKLSVMQKNRIHNQQTDEKLNKEKKIYHQLATIYSKLEGKKRFPFARESKLACYRAAGMIDDVGAQFTLGQECLNEAKYRQGLENGGVFASQNNVRTMNQLFEEAHAFLLSAEKLGHVVAKRTRGVCYINGWGVKEDKSFGFELVVASIQQENSWDKVPQIFASIGLNKPEFFSALTQARNKSF